MIKHIVLFKLQPFAEENSKHENALYIKKKLENLRTIIPEILKIEVFINLPEVSVENCDLILITEFNNLEDLRIYSNHPEHQKIVSFISKVKIDRSAIDYEM